MPSDHRPETPASRPLQNALESILAVYPGARTQPPSQHPEVGAVFAAAARALEGCPPIAAGEFAVDWGVGNLTWEDPPWISWGDSLESPGFRRGLFATLLFPHDSAQIHLALRLGVEEPKKKFGAADGLDSVRSRAKAIRMRYPALTDQGFRLAAPEGLGLSDGSKEDLAASVVLHITYDRGSIPEDPILAGDLRRLMAAYQYYLSSKPDVSKATTGSWLVRVDPDNFDLGGAVRQRDQLTWPVEPGLKVENGHKVFFWETGPRAGVVASARVTGDPDEREVPPEERAFYRGRPQAASLRVRLGIERVLPERLKPEDLQDHGSLSALASTDSSVSWRPLTADQSASLASLAARTATLPFDLRRAVPDLARRIGDRGFLFEPWQIATYVTALRTKPFVILAGVSGTGKSKLPALVAEAAGGRCELVAVRPDWTDSSDVLGYVDLQNRFRPGALLEVIRRAQEEPRTHFVCLVDEMNLARVEHYFAEVLSRIEDRRPAPGGGFESSPLLGLSLSAGDAAWGRLGLPPNLALVGTVNMDESAHGFSRKVLDRAFTMEFSEIHLADWQASLRGATTGPTWPVKSWFPRAMQLGGLRNLDDDERREVDRGVRILVEANRHLSISQLQVGYRTRDEIALFLLHARDLGPAFVTREDVAVDPLDLALQMKLLPRIAGGSHPVRMTLLGLLGWAIDGRATDPEDDGATLLARWEEAGRPWALEGARFPRTAARLALMWDRLLNEGFTSFWL